MPKRSDTKDNTVEREANKQESAVNNQDDLNKRIQAEIDTNPIVLYMKGDRAFPQCGFSARVVDVLEKLGVKYETHDILSDPELRFGMKNFSNWPTFPQLFVKG